MSILLWALTYVFFSFLPLLWMVPMETCWSIRSLPWRRPHSPESRWVTPDAMGIGAPGSVETAYWLEPEPLGQWTRRLRRDIRRELLRSSWTRALAIRSPLARARLS